MQCFDECIWAIAHTYHAIVNCNYCEAFAVKLADLANMLICLETDKGTDALLHGLMENVQESVGTDHVLPCL